MKHLTRSEFLIPVSEAVADNSSIKKIPVNEFANKEIPNFGQRSGTGLTQYTSTFGKTQLLHLLRHTLFGVTQADINHFTGKTLDQVVTELLTLSVAPVPPLNAYNSTGNIDPDVADGATWINAPPGSVFNSLRRKSFKQWWVGLMLAQERNLTEKMTWFWHNHFATQTGIIGDARYAYKQNALLRANALGNFKTLTRTITTDPGMLNYLNGNTNTKGSPNENYARELQELFTVGKGPDSHYTQADVETAARVLTGWTIDNVNIVAAFNSNKHDTADKVFSSFYNNTTITGQSGSNGALETDQLIDMIFRQTETARAICRKLYRWFVYYVIDATIETNVIIPLADYLVTNNYDIAPVLSTLLKSEHFFDTDNIGCHIKNPVDHVIGVCRQFNIAFPDATILSNQYKAWGIVASQLAALTMDPGDPPNVAGWPAYYQEPQYHELWINSDTLPLRNQITDFMGSVSAPAGGITLKLDFIAFVQQLSDPTDPDALIADAVTLLSPNDIGATQTAFVKSILLSGQNANHYWTDAWNHYVAQPGNLAYFNTVDSRLRSMFNYLLDLAEYQFI